MTPPCYTFSAAELPERVQFDVHGRQRKMPLSGGGGGSGGGGTDGTDGSRPSNNRRHRDVDLARDCVLLSSLVQYSCAVAHPERHDSPVRCWPVQRLFRRCQDRRGRFMVETTAWEGTQQGAGVVLPPGDGRAGARTAAKRAVAAAAEAEEDRGPAPRRTTTTATATATTAASAAREAGRTQRTDALREVG